MRIAKKFVTPDFHESHSVYEGQGSKSSGRNDPARPAKILGYNGPARLSWNPEPGRVGHAQFYFCPYFEWFFKENLNFIIYSFQIKHCSFEKMAEYRRNLRGILAKNGPARPAEILGLNGPAQST